MNAPLKICDKALSALYTVSVEVIAEVRMFLEKMCKDPSLDDDDDRIDRRATLHNGLPGYRKHQKHPMNRYPDAVRRKIEMHLDMILRADPGARDGVNTCRVYYPEIKTHEKLRKVLATHLEEDNCDDVHLSSSTMQRMIQDYLRDRNCCIKFTQSDHNACPNCKRFSIQFFSTASTSSL